MSMNERVIIGYRTSNAKAMDTKLVADDLFFAQFDMRDVNQNAVAGLSSLLSQIYTQSIVNTKEWGDLLKSDAGLICKRDFLGEYEIFSKFLGSECMLFSYLPFKNNSKLQRQPRTWKKL